MLIRDLMQLTGKSVFSALLIAYSGKSGGENPAVGETFKLNSTIQSTLGNDQEAM